MHSISIVRQQSQVSDAHEGLVTKSVFVFNHRVMLSDRMVDSVRAMDHRLDMLEEHISDLIEYMTQQPEPGDDKNNVKQRTSTV